MPKVSLSILLIFIYVYFLFSFFKRKGKGSLGVWRHMELCVRTCVPIVCECLHYKTRPYFLLCLQMGKKNAEVNANRKDLCTRLCSFFYFHSYIILVATRKLSVWIPVGTLFYLWSRYSTSFLFQSVNSYIIIYAHNGLGKRLSSASTEWNWIHVLAVRTLVKS